MKKVLKGILSVVLALTVIVGTFYMPSEVKASTLPSVTNVSATSSSVVHENDTISISFDIGNGFNISMCRCSVFDFNIYYVDGNGKITYKDETYYCYPNNVSKFGGSFNVLDNIKVTNENSGTHIVFTAQIKYYEEVLYVEPRSAGIAFYNDGNLMHEYSNIRGIKYVLNNGCWNNEHTWDAGVITTAPTCGATGVRTYTCSACGTTKKESIPATGNHTWDSGVVTKQPTCNYSGERTYTCSVCGATQKESVPTIDNHVWRLLDYIQPTYSEEGERIYYCQYCGDTRTEVIPKLVRSGTWKSDSRGWWYDNGDGTYPRNCWKEIGGEWYHFNSAGYMQTGWIYDGAWYYMNSSGAMATGWVNDGGTWYYMNSSGAMATGWVNDGGTWYYMNSSGAMQTGWVYSGGTWYYMTGSGAMASSQWVGNYYLTRSGAMATYSYVKAIDKDVYYWVGTDGAYIAAYDTTSPDLVTYRLAN